MSDIDRKEQAQVFYRNAVAYLGTDNRNSWKAVPSLRKAIKLEPEHLDAILLLIKCYRRGKVVRRNEEKVAALRLKAAQLGDARSQSETGANYYNGWWLNRDYEEAVKWLRLGAEQGNLDARCNLGTAYRLGDGVQQDPNKALECYREGARNNHVPSLYHLGSAYEHGFGVAKDATVAKVLYERAFNEAENGEYDSYVGLLTGAKDRVNGRFIYFAYGSNMFTPRLRDRVASAQLLGWGWTDEYRLTFDKVSSDGSGKATIVDAEDITTNGNEDSDGGNRGRPNRVWGVLFSIDNKDAHKLDQFEGLGHGYDKINIHIGHYLNETMNLASTSSIDAVTYFGTKRDKSLAPYDWYKEYVVAGAVEHELPEDYTHYLRGVPARRDTDCERGKREERFLSDHSGR